MAVTTALYHFDNSSQDVSGNSFDLTTIGTLSYTLGKFSQGITSFNATVNYLSKTFTPTDFETLFGITSDFTIELFVKIQAFDGLVLGITNDFGYQLIINISGNNLTCSYAGNYVGGYNIASLKGDGLFHHIAMVRNGSAITLYLDGIQVITGTTLVDMSVGTFFTMTVGEGLTSSSVVDELRISDSAVYTSNFTPPTSPFAITTTPVPRAKQTVADKFIYSLLQNPTDGLGLDAPVGSLALVDNGGSGTIWYKSGLGQLDWTMVGINNTNWTIGSSLSTTDTLTADAYFGSNATGYDGKIIFTRHGTQMMEFNTLNHIVLGKNTFVDYGSGKRVSISDQKIDFIQDSGSYDFFIMANSNELSVDATGNLLTLRASSLFEVLGNAGSYKIRSFSNHGGSNYEQMGHIDNVTIDNTPANFTFARAGGGFSANAIIHGVLTLVIRGTVDGNIGSVVFKKDYHIMNGTIIFEQDSFTSQDVNADVADLVFLSMSYASSTYTMSLKTKKNTKSMINSYLKVFVEEKVLGF